MQCRYGLQTLPIGLYISGSYLAILNFGHNTPLFMLLQTLPFLQNFLPEYSGIKILATLFNFNVELTLWKVVPYFMQCSYGLQTLPIGSNISGPCLAILNFSHNTPLCMLLQTLSFLQNFHPEYSGI